MGIWARGPMAHLFHGTHEQSYIAHVMMYASCVGPNQEHCENRAVSTPSPCPPASRATPILNFTSYCISLVLLMSYWIM